MPGGWQTYRCDHCPLILELGGSTLWDERCVVYSETVQVACAGCGTLHRITLQHGTCEVTALPGPIRTTRTVTLRDISGEEFESLEWVLEADWQPGGEHPGGIAALDQLACRHCGQAGQMLTLESIHAEPFVAGGNPREECPVCHGPMECFAVTDAV
jgi:hypothetical protein